MMSDEETTEDENILKRRRPDWRSRELNEFLDTLDTRSYQVAKHPRKVRVLGTPLKCPHPTGLTTWMVASPSQSSDSVDFDQQEHL